MAIKTLEIKKQIDETRKSLEKIELRKKEFTKREADLMAEIENASAETKETVEANVDAFNAEKAEAEQEETNLRDVLANLEKELEDAEKEQPSDAEKVIERKLEKMEKIELRNSAEYRDAFVKAIKTEDMTELRALLSENATSGTIPVPAIVDEIIRHSWEDEQIMSLVRKTYIKGNVKIGFERSATGAVIHTEGAEAPDVQTLLIGTVELVAESIKKYQLISDEVMDLEGDAFLKYIFEELGHYIAKKSADNLVAKIAAAPATSSATAAGVPQLTKAPALDTVASAIALLSDEATQPVVIMNKQTWAAFKAEQYSANFPVDPFEGMKVLFNNTLPVYSAATAGNVYMIVGDLGKGAQANFPNGADIKIKVDELSQAEADLVKIIGRMYVAVGVVAPNHFVNVKKPSTT